MKIHYITFLLIGLLLIHTGEAQVVVEQSDASFKLQVDSKDFMVKGMNWDHFPIGTNYTYSLWNQPDEFIRSVLDEEMALVKGLGVNTLRIYTGIPKQWITYIYDNHGIYTMLNYPFGRYGLSIDGVWVPNTDYSNSKVKELLIGEASRLANEYKDTPGLLMYLLGNENNYGLFYEDTEAQNSLKKTREPLPETRAMYKLFLLNKENEAQGSSENELSLDQKAAQRARHMYSLFNEGAKAMKAVDDQHPIAICNGDLMFIDIINEECDAVDVFGTNIYRGVSFGDTFQRVKAKLDKPLMFTEVGADAFNVITNAEDQESQAYYTLGNWKEIYANAAGIGGAENTIGGFTFQFSDGWWKYDQEKNLDVHDNTATWHNGGYYLDVKNGQNNMNEEWFGICAKVATQNQNEYDLWPRAAYFVLQEAHRFSPYESSVSLVELEEHFANIELKEAVKMSKGYVKNLKVED